MSKKKADKTGRSAKGYLWTFRSDGLLCFHHLRCLDSIPVQFIVAFQKSSTENIFHMVYNRQDWCYQRLASWLLCFYLWRQLQQRLFTVNNKPQKDWIQIFCSKTSGGRWWSFHKCILSISKQWSPSIALQCIVSICLNHMSTPHNS